MRLKKTHLFDLGIYVFYLALACIVTFPLIRDMGAVFAGDNLTDAYQLSRHSWWLRYALLNGEPIFDQPYMAYPDGMRGALIWANPFQFFPTWFFDFFMPLNVAYNLSLLLRLAMNGFAMFVLVRKLSGGQWKAGLLAGAIFLAYPAVQGRIYGGHLGVLFLWPMPLYVYAVYHLREQVQRRWFLLAALFVLLAPLGNTSMLVFYVLPIVGMLLLYQLIVREWAWFRRSVLVTVAGLGLALIFLVPVALENADEPQYDTNIGGIVTYSADALGLVSPSFNHPLYDEWEYNRNVLGVNLVEGIAYVGILPLLLALWGIIRRKEARWLLALAVVAWIFSLGPVLKYRNDAVYTSFTSVNGETIRTTVTLPWIYLQNLPLLDAVRTPGRFNLVLGFAVATLAGYGLSAAWGRIKQEPLRLAIVAVLLPLVVYDYQSFWGMPTANADIPAGVLALRDEDGIRAVLNVPWDDRILTKIGLYYQSAHEHPITTGQFVRDTPVSRAKLNLLQQTLDPAMLYNNGIDRVLVHFGGYHSEALFERALTTLGAPSYQDERVAIFVVPETPHADNISVQSAEASMLERENHTYIYTPQPAWVRYAVNMTAAADDTRRVLLQVEDDIARDWTANTSGAVDVPLFLPEGGFYDVNLRLDPTCPVLDSAAVQCRALTLDNFQVEAITLTDTLNPTAHFSRGVTLDYYFDAAADVPMLYLWWQFEEPLTEFDVRFVHVIAENGELAAQFDAALPTDYAYVGAWGETFRMAFLEPLPAGTYQLRAGWYTYPDLIRFPVAGYPDGAVDVGTLVMAE